MLGRNTDRPDSQFQNGKYAILENLWFAELLCYHYIDSNIKETSNYNGTQSLVLNNEVVEI